MNSDKKLFLIDGSSFLYRAYYGLRPLHTTQGAPVQAVYGFCRMIQKLINLFSPHAMALVWDSKGKTARHEIFHDYKATRQAPPSDLFDQKELIVEFASSLDLHQFAKDGVEADDLMYSLAKEWEAQGGSVVIISSDKDMGQVITEHIILYDFFKEQFLGLKEFQEKMGFDAKKVPFYFALLGDSSDNIPGVKGIGKKGAQDLVMQFDSLKDLYDNIDKVTAVRTKTALIANKENAFLSERLFLLHYYKTEITQEQLAFDQKKWSQARSFFEKLDFKSLAKSLPDAPTTATVAAPQATLAKSSKEKGYVFTAVTTLAQLHELVATITEKKLCAYDTETDGLVPLQAKLVGVSLCYQEGTSFYIPCGHETTEEQLTVAQVITALKPLFEDSAIKKIAHHAKFDQLVLFHQGIKVQGTVFDTLIAASLIKPEWQKASLKALSEQYLNEPMLTFAQMVTDKKHAHFGFVPISEALEYAAADALQTFKLYPLFEKELIAKNMHGLYYSIELPLVQVLCEMEARGIYCDREILQILDATVIKKLQETQKTMLDLLGPDFASMNFNSPKQVEELLFGHLKLTPQKKSEKRSGYSTDNEVLVSLAKVHPIPGYIAQYRELFKLKSTYIDALPEYINPETGKIHTTYSQIRVATGRLASSDPNLQNIPAEGLGCTVRMAFKPEHGHLFLSADYSQIELRVLAHLSGDQNLKAAFLQGLDIHAQTAAQLFNIPVTEVTKQQRTVGKRINFSILYGLTPFGLAKDLDIPHKDAKQYIDTYFSYYPGVRVWMDSVVEQAKKDGYVTTLFGRRRFTTGIHERNRNLFELAKRIAINTVAQGTAAEIMKIGMLRVDVELKKHGYDAFLLLQIHDEIIVSCNPSCLEEVKKLVTTSLETVVAWETPLIVDTAVGKNWKEVS